MMTPNFYHLLSSSFLLWLNHNFFNKSQAFTNVSSLFYPINNVSGFQGETIYGLYTYASPYSSQMISDGSINNATVMTGIYLNNNFITPGTSGFLGINYEKSQLYFNQQLPQNSVLSGNYTIKDFSLQLTNVSEQKLLYETQYVTRPRVAQNLTAAPLNSISYPCILIKTIPDENVPHAFGGLDESKVTMGCLIFTDSQYLLDGTVGYLNDMVREYVPLLKQSEFPYNIYGSFINSGIYSYTGSVSSKIPNGSGVLIKRVIASRFDQTDIGNVSPSAFFATVDFELSAFRYPRMGSNF